MPNELTMLCQTDGSVIITHVHHCGFVAVMKDIINDDKVIEPTEMIWSPYLEDGKQFMQQEASHFIELFETAQIEKHTYVGVVEFKLGTRSKYG